MKDEKVDTCPNCGYCPTCGRAKAVTYPVYPGTAAPYPYTRPWWGTGGGTTSTPSYPNTTSSPQAVSPNVTYSFTN